VPGVLVSAALVETSFVFRLRVVLAESLLLTNDKVDSKMLVGRDRMEAYLPSGPKYSQRCNAIGTLPFFQTKS
jgi:hypothetical protein